MDDPDILVGMKLSEWEDVQDIIGGYDIPILNELNDAIEHQLTKYYEGEALDG